MKNLKKLLAAVLVIAMMVTIMIPAFAAEESTFSYAAEAQKLKDLGLYNGVSTDTFNPDLGAALDRQTGVVMLLRIFGLEADALALTDADTILAKFTDAASIADWAKKQVAYAVQNGLVKGAADATFAPSAALEGKAYCTLILRQLGFADADYATAPSILAEKGGLTADEATQFTSKDLMKNDLVGISFGALSATNKDGEKVIDVLVADKVVDETAAVDAGLVDATPAVTITALDVKSAVAINSKTVEISLDTAATAEDVAAATITVKDSAAKDVVVKSAELAAYNTDKKAVLVTLEADTAAGTLYTLTVGTKSVNFGGKSADTTKPTVSKVESTDYNQIKITFSEAVKLEGGTFTVAEKYGSKAALAVSDMKYDGKDKIVLTSADQKGSTLYGITIENVVDLAGNKMDKDDAKTFVGMKKDDTDLKISTGNVKANDYNHVVVEFNKKVDETTIAGATFTIAEAYGSKTAITVASAAKASKDDSYAGTDDSAALSVLLTLDGALKASTLYKVTVAGTIKSVYGKALSTTDSDKEKTFVGVAKPTSELEYNGVAVGSNTEITVSFKQKVDKTLAENIANYTIAESYGTKAALAITAAALQDNNKDVKLTVATMKNVLYKITTTNIKDIYGNAIKTSSDANITTFVGKAIAEKIKSVEFNNRKSETEVWVKFDKNTGANAIDVSNYSIDNGIGYPEAAVQAVSDDDAVNYKSIIKLTIPKTVVGKVYKLTVKNLKNSDGIAMATDDKVECTFVGKGTDATRAEIVAVMAIDARTVKLFFDRAADDSTIKGATRIWSAEGANGLVANSLSLSINGDDDAADANEYDFKAFTPSVWKDPADANCLIIRFATDRFTSDIATSSSDTFKLIANSGKVKSDSSANIKEFNNNNDKVAQPELVNAYMLNSTTIDVYFSEPVIVNALPGDFKIYTTEAGTTTVSNAGTPVVVSSTTKVSDTEYKLVLNKPLLTTLTGVPTNKAMYLYLASTSAEVTDKSTLYKVKPNTDGGDHRSVEFGTNDTAANNDRITSVSVFMPNKRTIEVYYPERMLATAVKDVTNYRLVANSDGNIDATSQIFAAGIADYDADTMKATLYLTADIDTLRTGAPAVALTKYYFAIDDSVANETSTNTIKNDKTAIANLTNGIVVELAPSTASNPIPKLSTATVSDDRFSMDVKFDQKVIFPSVVGDVNARTFTATSGAIGAQELLDGLAISAQFEGEASATPVVAGDIASASINADHDTATITFKVKLAESKSGTVGTKGAVADKVKNKQGISAAITGDDASELPFAAAPSIFADASNPVIVGAVVTGGGNWGVVDKVLTLTYSENITLSAAAIAADADVLLAGTQLDQAGVIAITGVNSVIFGGGKVTAAVSGNTLTLTIVVDLGTGILSTNVLAGTATGLVTDTAGNAEIINAVAPVALP